MSATLIKKGSKHVYNVTWLSHDKIIISQYSSSIGNGVGSKTVKMTEIEKYKIQVSMKVGYELYVPEVSDLAINIFSVPLQHYI